MKKLSPPSTKTPLTEEGQNTLNHNWQRWFSDLFNYLKSTDEETPDNSGLQNHISKTGTAVHGLGTASTKDVSFFDLAGAAQTVQTNLDNHIIDNVAEFADIAISIANVSNDLSTHIEDVSNPHQTTYLQVSAVPNTATVNGYLLTSNPVLAYGDVGAAPTVHTHSKLIASDGSPDPALSIDATGNALVNVGTLKIIEGQKYLYGDYDMYKADSVRSNTYIGDAGNLTGTGTHNFGMGYGCMKGITWGYENDAIGYNALRDIRGGGQNIALGSAAGAKIVDGNSNICIGIASGSNNLNGSGNISIGVASLGALISANNSTAVGTNSLTQCTYGAENQAFGCGALYFCKTGNYNTALGYFAGAYYNPSVANETPSFGTYIGRLATSGAANAQHEIVIGSSTVGHGSNTVTIGESTNTDNYLTGNLNVAIGNIVCPEGYAFKLGTTNAYYAQTAQYNIFLATSGNLTNSGAFNIGAGIDCFKELTSGGNNCAFGHYSMGKNTSGGGNTALGVQSLQKNTTGLYNSAFGLVSLSQCTSGQSNTSIGYSSLSGVTTGYGNVGIGVSSGASLGNGWFNVLIGTSALVSAIGASECVAIGTSAAAFDENGDANTSCTLGIYIGSNCKTKLSGRANEIVIGNTAIGHGSDTVTIGNANITNNYFKGALNLASGTLDASPEAGQLEFNVDDFYASDSTPTRRRIDYKEKRVCHHTVSGTVADNCQVAVCEGTESISLTLRPAIGSGALLYVKNFGIGTVSITADNTGTPDLIDASSTKLCAENEAYTLLDFEENQWLIIAFYTLAIAPTTTGFLKKTDGDYLLKTDGGKIELVESSGGSGVGSTILQDTII